MKADLLGTNKHKNRRRMEEKTLEIWMSETIEAFFIGSISQKAVLLNVYELKATLTKRET